jgi:hypothetical protein
MTDENEALKRKIKQLERDLVLQKVGDDPRKLALLAAGVPADRLSDASKVFRPSGSAEGMMKFGDETGDINSLAKGFLASWPWFGVPEPEAKPEPDDNRPRIEDDRAYFKDGSSLPVDMLSSDDLFNLAGPEPKPKAPEPKPDEAYINEGESDLDRDFRLAGATPKKAAS